MRACQSNALRFAVVLLLSSVFGQPDEANAVLCMLWLGIPHAAKLHRRCGCVALHET